MLNYNILLPPIIHPTAMNVYIFWRRYSIVFFLILLKFNGKRTRHIIIIIIFILIFVNTNVHKIEIWDSVMPSITQAHTHTRTNKLYFSRLPFSSMIVQLHSVWCRCCYVSFSWNFTFANFLATILVTKRKKRREKFIYKIIL